MYTSTIDSYTGYVFR